MDCSVKYLDNFRFNHYRRCSGSIYPQVRFNACQVIKKQYKQFFRAEVKKQFANSLRNMKCKNGKDFMIFEMMYKVVKLFNKNFFFIEYFD